jgi:hypothetical protein
VPYVIYDHEPHVTASVGIVIYQQRVWYRQLWGAAPLASELFSEWQRDLGKAPKGV